MGLMLGTGEHTFSPYSPMTRAQMATIAARMLKLPTSNSANIPNDVQGHWAQKEISAVYEANVMQGYPDGNFYPDREASREETAVFLSRVIKSETTNEKPDFTDIDESRWSYDEICALANSGILTGYPDKTFRPEKIIDRGEMATLLNRISKQ